MKGCRGQAAASCRPRGSRRRGAPASAAAGQTLLAHALRLARVFSCARRTGGRRRAPRTPSRSWPAAAPWPHARRRLAALAAVVLVKKENSCRSACGCPPRRPAAIRRAERVRRQAPRAWPRRARAELALRAAGRASGASGSRAHAALLRRERRRAGVGGGGVDRLRVWPRALRQTRFSTGFEASEGAHRCQNSPAEAAPNQPTNTLWFGRRTRVVRPSRQVCAEAHA